MLKLIWKTKEFIWLLLKLTVKFGQKKLFAIKRIQTFIHFIGVEKK